MLLSAGWHVARPNHGADMLLCRRGDRPSGVDGAHVVRMTRRRAPTVQPAVPLATGAPSIGSSRAPAARRLQQGSTDRRERCASFGPGSTVATVEPSRRRRLTWVFAGRSVRESFLGHAAELEPPDSSSLACSGLKKTRSATTAATVSSGRSTTSCPPSSLCSTGTIA